MKYTVYYLYKKANIIGSPSQPLHLPTQVS